MVSELTYRQGRTCQLCGCALYDGYPFTVCDGCWDDAEVDPYICPSDHVVLPRAEVEALRARCERLREHLLWLVASDPPPAPRLEFGDLADNLHSLDDLPLLKGADDGA